ncbi:hypothetical protein [Streptomyces avermitilis]|uniref:hypothetical protein n=1 Tax=Streptomyces avermitilis TaxID=33903 RepID=UPI0033D8AB7A
MHSFSPESLLAVRFHNARPGLELVTIIDAALPVALITADVLAQDSKNLPLMDEFVLRLVDHRVTSQHGISGMLGLPERMVDQTLAELFRSDDLRWAPPVPGGEPGNPRLRLTDKGRVTADTAAAVEPVRVNQAVVYDQMLWKVAPYNRDTTVRRGQAEEDGLIMLPVARSGPVEDGDITAADITALLRENGKTDREVLQVKSISQAPSRRVLPVKILVYADEERTEIQLGVVVDGELSHAHELALIGHGGARTLGITVAPPSERPSLNATWRKPGFRCRKSPSTARSKPPSSSAPRTPPRPRRRHWSLRRTRSGPSVSSSTRRSSKKPSPTPGAACCSSPRGSRTRSSPPRSSAS